MSRYAQIMIKIVGDSDGGGSKRQMEGGGIDARKRATSMRRTSVRLVMATIMIEQITEGMLDHDLIEGTP